MLVRTVIGIVGMLAAAWMAVGIWVPRFRSCWKGSRAPLGSLSTAGFALGTFAFGAWSLTDGMRLPFPQAWFAIAFVAGWICAAIGWGIDTKSIADRSQASNALL